MIITSIEKWKLVSQHKSENGFFLGVLEHQINETSWWKVNFVSKTELTDMSEKTLIGSMKNEVKPYFDGEKNLKFSVKQTFFVNLL